MRKILIRASFNHAGHMPLSYHRFSVKLMEEMWGHMFGDKSNSII